MREYLFPTINNYLKDKFGERVQKIPLDAGMTCPNRDGKKGYGGCTYCDHTGSGTGKGKISTITEQMLNGIIWAKKKYHARKFIAYFQSFSNTYHPDKDYLRDIFTKSLVSDDVVGIAIGTRPDCVDENCLEVLKEISKGRFLLLELGLQSAHNKTLEKINRCHGVEDFIFAINLTHKHNIPVCVHIIFGLPDETLDDMKETILFLKDKPISGIKFHNLYIHRDTVLEKVYKNQGYTPIDQKDYANLVAWSIKQLPQHIIIHRLTGDPNPKRLVAPLWALDKSCTINLIKEKLRELQ